MMTRTKSLALLTTAFALGACGGNDGSGTVEMPGPIAVAPTPTPSPSPTPDPNAVPPTGGLEQPSVAAPITFTTGIGWRVEVAGGAITVRPRIVNAGDPFAYTTRGTNDVLGTTQVHAWAGGRRTLMLAGGTKITLQSDGGVLTRATIYDGDQAHEIDVVKQSVIYSRVDAAATQARDAGEADGETAHLYASLARDEGGRNATWLYLANLYTQTGTETPVITPQPLGEQRADSVRLLREPLTLAPVQADASCAPAGTATGRLTQGANAVDYVTSGGWRISMRAAGQLWVQKPRAVSWEVAGSGLMEELGRTKIKTWSGHVRTLILEDGTKITSRADGNKVIQQTSIYDREQSHEVSHADIRVVHSCVKAQVARDRDAAELDGETGYLVTLRTPGMQYARYLLTHLYNETARDSAGNGQRRYNFTPLAALYETLGGNGLVDDYYDDPRSNET